MKIKWLNHVTVTFCSFATASPFCVFCFTANLKLAALLLGCVQSPVKNSALVHWVRFYICSHCCNVLSLIPKQWFQPSQTMKMKQALGLISKDSNTSAAVALWSTDGITTGTSSAF